MDILSDLRKRFRIFDLSVVDILGTILAGYLIASYYELNLGLVLAVLFVLGEIIHIIFNIDTPITRLLSTKERFHYSYPPMYGRLYGPGAAHYGKMRMMQGEDEA